MKFCERLTVAMQTDPTLSPPPSDILRSSLESRAIKLDTTRGMDSPFLRHAAELVTPVVQLYVYLIYGTVFCLTQPGVDFVPGGWIAGDTKPTFLLGVLNCA